MTVEEHRVQISEGGGYQTGKDENEMENVEQDAAHPQQVETKNPPEEGKQSFMQAATSKALRPFVIISTSYLLFTGAQLSTLSLLFDVRSHSSRLLFL